MEYFLKHFSAITVCIGLMLAAGIISCMLLYFVRMLLKEYRKPAEAINAISVLHSLILAFIIAAVWQDHEELNKQVMEESAKLEEIKLHCTGLPAPVRTMVIAAVNSYAAAEANEWDQQSVAGHTNDRLTRLRDELLAPAIRDGVFHNTVTAIDNDLIDAIKLQHERYSNSRSHMPGIVWFVLICGSLLVILCGYFSPATPYWLDYTFNALLAAMMAMCLFLAYALDHPLTGTSGVSSGPFKNVASHINQLNN